MTNNSKPKSGLDVPEAIVEDKKRLPIIWLIPLLAALVAGWLVFTTLNEQGPELVISFANAEGLEVGKTRLKYKEVVVGKVTDIQLSNDLSHVEVTARLNRSAGTHLSGDTSFWVVRPRISSSGISGLTTLISGVYIGMDLGSNDSSPRKHYQGLDETPYLRSDIGGTTFTLNAESLASLDIGSAIYYRHIKVGELVKYELASTGRSVKLELFINEPYDSLVKQNSHFWNASGFELRLTSEGVTAKLESLAALMSGGISFHTPLDFEEGAQANSQDTFILYPDFASTAEKQYSFTLPYLMHFTGSLRGLNPGAPVEYRGIKVGEVIDISIQMDRETYELEIPVLVAFHPDRIAPAEEFSHPQEALDALVAKGLRAQLKPGNLLTGQMYIDLEKHPNSKTAIIATTLPYPTFPTVEASLDTITRSVTDLFSKIEQMPILEITQEVHKMASALRELSTSPEASLLLSNLNESLLQIEQLAKSANLHSNTIYTNLDKSLIQLTLTLEALEGTVAQDSLMYHDVTKMIRELSTAARSVKDFTDYLQRNPDALIFGKDNLTR